jgi:uncharacterized protein (TIGR03435 family)
MRLVVMVLISYAAFGQSEFESASATVNKSAEVVGHGNPTVADGQFIFLNYRMSDLIGWAYDARTEAIAGGPDWVDSDRFDIIAKAPPNTSMADARLMLRALLAERFKLTLREDQKIMPVFAMVVAKQGPVLTPSANSGEPRCANARSGHREFYVDCTNMTVAELADHLPRLAPRYISLPVVDMTGIKGNYDFRLAWVPKPVQHTYWWLGTTIFDDLENGFGLKLKKQEQAIPILVINHIEH